MKAILDMEGKTFGRWTVLARDPIARHRDVTWFVRCECGTETSVTGSALRNGYSHSCGCLNREVNSSEKYRHGMSHTSEYRIWANMRQRCSNEKHVEFSRYGGRGITVCARWNNFANFFADMGLKPTASHSLDRKEVNGNYEPQNCRWATLEEQNNNKRTSRLIQYRGRQMSLTQAVRVAGSIVKIPTVQGRLVKGWTVSDAVETPAGERP